MTPPSPEIALPWLREPLQAALSATREHHLLLLHGPPGVGQFELALSLAQAWLCEAETAAAAKPCGACASCKLVRARNHPDLLVLLPEVLQEALGWTARDDEEASGGSRDRKPSKEIKVDAARQAIAFAQTSSARGRAKVVLIHPAERLNPIAANTLLKTLEEPPGVARFVLACGAPDALPPTVRSRCQPFALGAPPAEAAAAWLVEQGVERPQVLLAATGGQPLEALTWVREGIDAGTWARLPQQVAAGDASGLQAWPVPRFVDAMLKLCHDAMLGLVGMPPRYFPATPSARAMAPLEDWRRELLRTARDAEHPFNAGLLVESLVAQGRLALQGGRAPLRASLHSPS